MSHVLNLDVASSTKMRMECNVPPRVAIALDRVVLTFGLSLVAGQKKCLLFVTKMVIPGSSPSMNSGSERLSNFGGHGLI